ncbi:LPD38 domain-containing protein [Fontivita pretiosa]|uniref:LPD38 domain-containing protein n=1 Tax=Fontivita pretiosa TaxID=2989684 RepID=UPI003D181F03
MDAFDLAEQQLDQHAVQFLQKLGEGTYYTRDGTRIQSNPSGATAVIELPDEQPPPPLPVHARPQLRITSGPEGISYQQGGDAFEQAEARLATQQAMQRGENLVPYLQRQTQAGVSDVSLQPQIDAWNAYVKAAEPRTTVGAQSIDYPTWLRLRRNFQLNYPTSPLPAQLQVFHTGGGEFIDDKDRVWQAPSAAELFTALEQSTDRPLLHDPELIAEARRRWAAAGGKGAPPEVLQGTIEQRTAAAAKAAVQAARVRYGPATDRMSDEEVLKFDADQQEKQAAQLIVNTTRALYPGMAKASDEQILQMARQHPRAIEEAIARAVLPKAMQDARDRIARRSLAGGPLAEDSAAGVNQSSDEQLLKKGRVALIAEQTQAAMKQHPLAGYLIGAFGKWAHAANLGLPGLVARLGGEANAERYEAFQQTYSAQYPYTTLAAAVAGYMTPGSPAYFLQRGLGKAIGQPIREGVAATTTARSGAGALKAATTEAAAGTMAKAPLLARAAAQSIAAGVEMPFYAAAESIIEGKPSQALQALDVGQDQTRQLIAGGMIAAPIMAEATRLVMAGTRAVVREWQYTQRVNADARAHFKDLGIELTPEGKAALSRVARMHEHINEGLDPIRAASEARVTLKDLSFARDLQARLRAARESIKSAPAGQARAAKTAGAQTQPKAAGVASGPQYQPPRPGRELLGPRDAMVMRHLHLIDQYAPRQPDGTRKFTMPFYDEALKKQSELRKAIEALSDETVPTDDPVILQRRKLLALARQIDRRYAQEKADLEARRGKLPPVQGVEGRAVPAPPAKLGQPNWRPSLRSMSAAKARARSKGIVTEGVQLSATQQIAVNQIVDVGKPDAANVQLWVAKLRPGESSQADAVPPIVVRKLASGGYQVLDGADQLAAARLHDFTQVPVIVAHGAAAPPPTTRQLGPRRATGQAPRALIAQDKAAQKSALMAAARPGEIIHGTDARNLPFIARQGVQPSALSELIDAELVPEGGFAGGQIPSTAAGYAVGRAREIPVLLVFKPHTNRGTPDRALSARHVAATSPGKSYLAAQDIEAVIFPDGRRLPLDRAIEHYQALKEQLGVNLPERAQAPAAPKRVAQQTTQRPSAGDEAPEAARGELQPGHQAPAKWDFVDTFPQPIETDPARLAELGFNPGEDGKISGDELAAVHELLANRIEELGVDPAGANNLAEWEEARAAIEAALSDYREVFGEEAFRAYIRMQMGERPEQFPDEAEAERELEENARDLFDAIMDAGGPSKIDRLLRTERAELLEAVLKLPEAHSVRTYVEAELRRREVEGKNAGGETAPPKGGKRRGKQQKQGREQEAPQGDDQGQAEGGVLRPTPGPAAPSEPGEAAGPPAPKGEQPVEQPAPPAMTIGRPTMIQTTGSPVAAHYAVIEAADLVPSHQVGTLKPDPRYPPNVQERDYQHDKEERAKIDRQVLQFNPDFVLTDNPDPVNGPPMVLRSGLVMGGNSRAITLQEVYAGRGAAAALRAATVQAGEKFGIAREAIEKLKQPLIVRVIDENVTTASRMRQLVRDLQKGRTQELNPAMDAAARARILLDNPDTLDLLQQILGDDDSVREVLAQPAKVSQIRNWLVSSGVLSKQEHSRFTDTETGMLNEEGKRLIERTLQAVVVGNPDKIANLPHPLQNKLVGNLFALVYPKTKGQGWDLGRPLQLAIDGYYRWAAAGKPPIDDWLRGEAGDGQTLMNPDTLATAAGDTRARWMLRRLVTDNTVGWRQRMRAYLSFARAADPEQQRLFAGDKGVQPSDAFYEAFEIDAPRDISGKPVGEGNIEKRGGGLFAGGAEQHLHNLDALRELLSWPELMSPRLRGVLGLPRRLRVGGIAMMSTAGGGKPVSPAELLKDPATAEHLARIATFHLEVHTEAGDKMLARWAADVRSDLGGILRDLGYAVDDAGWTELLRQLWSNLSADADVKAVLGTLPEFDQGTVTHAQRRAAQRGTPASGRGNAAGGAGQSGGELGGDTGSGSGQPGTGVVPGEGPEPLPPEPASDAGVPEWVGPGQAQQYLDALGSERVSPYVPLAPWRRGHHHPRLLVESKALAGIERGDFAGYEPDGRAVVNLSDPQRDQVLQIGYRINIDNAGALIADDVGVGKSRIIGGVIADQVYRGLQNLGGKQRILVLTKNRQNISDLVATFTREMVDTFTPLMRDNGLQIHNALDLQPDAVAALGAGAAPVVVLADAFNLVKYAEALQQLNPDLVIVDEAHLFSNLEGDTARANTLQALHEHLMPNDRAHFVYLTATPASDIAALKFMYGLKLWHPPKLAEQDPDLKTFDQWLQDATGVTRAGSWRQSLATPIIEQLMRELKMDNAYASLDFWRGGFEFEMRQAKVSPELLEAYDAAADVLREAIQAYAKYRPQVNHPKWPNAKGTLSAPPRPDGQAIFFMKRLLVQFRMAAAVEEAKASLARGEQVVFKVLGVSDTYLSGGTGNLSAVLDAIPTQRARKNNRGEIQAWEPIPGAAETVAELRARAATILQAGKVESPLAQLLNEFGQSNVAAIVGDTPPAERVSQNAEFQSGKRRVAVISQAGTTGINLQDLGGGRRHMIFLDLDWDAKEFKQSLGRIDRANQLSSPRASTIYTPIAGERKFQATIATRLRSLGAISKGQEDAGAEQEALNDFDMETSTWHRAINETVRSLPDDKRRRLLHAVKLQQNDELSWRDFQNDLMFLPVAEGNGIFEQAFERWKQLEELEVQRTGGRVARRNRGMIRQTVQLDESIDSPLAIHAVESVTGESYGILQGKLLTRPESAIALHVIQDAIYGKGGSQTLRNHYVTMQQGERVVTGLYVPRGKIEAVKALFGKASQRELFAGRKPDEPAPHLPEAMIDQLPPVLSIHATPVSVPPAVQAQKHRPLPAGVSRQDIVNHVVRRLKLAVAKGKQARFRARRGGRVLGYYWNRLIRLHVANDIAVTAHEVGHAIDDALTGLTPPTTFDAELLPLGKNTSRRSYTKLQVRREGVAEFFRLYMYDPQTAMQQAPMYGQWFEAELLRHPELWEAVKDLQQLYAEYLAQDPVAKLESQIDWRDEGPTQRSPIREGTLDYLYRHLFDDRRPLDALRRELGIGGDGPLPDRASQDAYVLSRLLPGVRKKVYGWVKFGVRSRSGRKLADGLEPILKKNGITGRRLRQFEAYLVARRADELYRQEAAGQRTLANVIDAEGGKLGVSHEQALATIRKYDSPAFRAAADGWYAWNRAVFRYLGRTGFFDPAALAQIRHMNQNWVRFDRVLDETAMHAAGNRSLVDKGRQFFRIKGSGRRIRRPIAASIANILRIVEAVDANDAALAALRMIQQGKDYRWADRISRPIAPTTGQLEEIKKALIAAGVDPADMQPGPGGADPKIDLSTMFTIFRPVRHNPRDMEVALRVRGKIHVWQIHVPALYDALTLKAGNPTTNILIRLMIAAKNIKRWGFTSLPDFLSSNIQRDQLTAFVQSRYGFKPGIDFALGLMHILSGDKTYQLFLQSGAGSATYTEMARDTLQRMIDDMGRSKVEMFLRKTLLPSRWIDLVNANSVILEEATRVGEFARALAAEGVNEEGLVRAGLAARDVTVDFFRGGQWVREKAATRAFLNAAFQGPDYMTRHLLGRGGQKGRKKWAALNVLLKVLGAITLPSLVLHYLSRQNPDYQERRRERELYWLIPIGNPLTTTRWFRIRKPHELGMIFGSLGESLVEWMIANDPRELKRWIPDRTTGMDLLMGLMDDLFLPLLEVTMNYDYFRGRPIVPEAIKELEPQLQYTRWTSETSKLAGHYLNLSPAMLDHLIYGYFGTAGRTVVGFIDDAVTRRLMGTIKAPPPAMDPEQHVPGLRVFFSRDLDPNGADSVAEFYSKYDRLQTVLRSLRAFRDEQQRERYRVANQQILAQRAALESAHQTMKEMRNAMIAIFDDAQLDPQTKRQRLRQLAIEMINVARAVNGRTPYNPPDQQRSQ